ncbi:phosphoglucosamine mutase [Archaeoglobus sulfaticallidus PM70-1]|uniref:Phosphoglucosamine mutase n=1 Tax=Archaeoglobus sulfaticallidus PM70-1 TaxID=387631 RepID=N0B9J3_9EURY|nr:phosphoglucosamine mutase [Archaeoglobus sulfaticallidus]AGK60274.1 phosphoglucosamine mutase [Archaeoglobus sulfaticallidus PM70-1]
MTRIGGAGELFGTNGVRGVANEELTAEMALNLGRVIGSLRKGRIAIATDARISSQMLKCAVIAGITSVGSDVIDLGVAPTPALQYYVKMRDVTGGVIVTASHNPREYNGIKFVHSDGTEFTREMDEESERVYKSKDFMLAKWNEVGQVFEDDCRRLYIDGIKSRVDQGLIAKKKFRVVIDCGNGAAVFTTPQLLKELGCEVISINAHPDGTFPQRSSEPVEENVELLKKVVKETSADLGIAHDGDADRATFVDENGNFISEDVMLALMAEYYVRSFGGKVVTPISSSKCVEDAVLRAGGEIVYTAVGSPVVVKVMKEINAVFGGEGNGGLIFPEFQLTRDGAMSAAKVLELMAKEDRPISELVKDIPRYYTLKEKMGCDNKRKLLDGLRKEFPDANFTDGARIDYDDGWILIRPSGTEPIVRIFAEATTKSRAEELIKEGMDAVRRILG